MKTLIVLYGLPRSGKSTWSRSHGAPIVSGDAIRLAIHGTPFIQDSEDLVLTFGLYMIKTLFYTGYDTVIADDCYFALTRSYRQKFVSSQWKNVYKIIDTPEDICIDRAYKTDQPYLIPVIKMMNERFEPLGEDELLYEE